MQNNIFLYIYITIYNSIFRNIRKNFCLTWIIFITEELIYKGTLKLGKKKGSIRGNNLVIFLHAM